MGKLMMTVSLYYNYVTFTLLLLKLDLKNLNILAVYYIVSC